LLWQNANASAELLMPLEQLFNQLRCLELSIQQLVDLYGLFSLSPKLLCIMRITALPGDTQYIKLFVKR
jgi:hypothetical protein